MLVYNDLTRMQNKLMKACHSANIFEDQMYLYGGIFNGDENEDLSIINLSTNEKFQKIFILYLETLKVIRRHMTTGSNPGIKILIDPFFKILGPLYDHLSLLKDGKIYLYGGKTDRNSQSSFIFIFDIGNQEFFFDFECLQELPSGKGSDLAQKRMALLKSTKGTSIFLVALIMSKVAIFQSTI